MMDTLNLILYSLAVYLIWKCVFNMPDYIIYYAKYSFYAIYIQIISALLIPVMLLSPRNLRNEYMFAKCMLPVSKVIGISWKLRNEKVLAGKTSAVLIGNHQSYLDILGVFHFNHMTKRIAFVNKKEVFYYFPLGLASYLMGCLFLDRENPRDAYNTLKVSGGELFKNKYKIAMYAEGTRNKNNKMRPFKNGPFFLAITYQVPIIPVVTSPYLFLDSEKRVFRKGPAIIQCLDPVPTKGLTMDDLPQLKESIQKKMQETYDELGKELAATQKLHKDIN